MRLKQDGKYVRKGESVSFKHNGYFQLSCLSDNHGMNHHHGSSHPIRAQGQCL